MSSNHRKTFAVALILSLAWTLAQTANVPTCASSQVRASEVRWNELYSACRGCVSAGANGCSSGCCRVDISKTQYYICRQTGCCLRFIESGPDSYIIAYEPVAASAVSAGQCQAPSLVPNAAECPTSVCALEYKEDGLVTCSNGYDVPALGSSTASSLCPQSKKSSPETGSDGTAARTTAAPSTSSTAKTSKSRGGTDDSDSGDTSSGEENSDDDSIAGSKDDDPSSDIADKGSGTTALESNPVSCFPADATVTLSSGLTRTMAELKVGDEVLVGAGNTFSRVFMFTHRLSPQSMTLSRIAATAQKADAPARAYEFVQLETSAKHTAILTASHFLYINNELAPAANARVGDCLQLADGKQAEIVRISTVRKPGLYNPQTLHGDIVVNGIVTSTYTTAVRPVLAHQCLLPLRTLYGFTGSSLRFFEQSFHDVFRPVPFSR